MSNKELKYFPPSMERPIQVVLDDKIVHAASEHMLSYAISEKLEDSLKISCLELTTMEPECHLSLLVSIVEALFSHNSKLKRIYFDKPHADFSTSKLTSYFDLVDSQLYCERKKFYQYPLLWHRNASYEFSAEDWSYTQDRYHPKRPPAAEGVIYRRYIPALQKEISFALLDLETDLDIFWQWHNQHRIAKFWELKKPKDELREYLLTVFRDPHQIPVIAYIDNEAVGYFEVYWAYEDRLGPYYPAEPYDRGFHFLIGNPRFLGGLYTEQLLKAITHMIFLDEARTRRVMGEPRFDNQKVIRYLEVFPAWKKLKEFDFPHKRALLLECRREDFFEGGSL